ncbi:hypothetical protein [Candidatus Blochmannia ocreatus (nom. nud.)]|uniref:Uncharacterized protein n=1 Tax=Candidatus Blochmannia ocreatus (nom. nud.) TaxID=251538 RepID=A0ABY4STT5_9ENTR|nr:hypothetical protein [Candidatus Blochmannia ocreatus]URJ25385.1 hypothetical protein M9405_01545 [Candidatus Blochmannia ocreatus]
MQSTQGAGLKLEVHPLSGSGIEYWQNIDQYFKLDLNLISDKIDKTFQVYSY